MEQLGGGRRPLVKVTVNGHTYESAIASTGGRFLISLSAENRAAAGVAAGDEVDVTVEFDTRRSQRRGSAASPRPSRGSGAGEKR